MLEHGWLVVVVDPDKEALSEAGPSFHSREAHDVPVVAELAVAGAWSAAVGAGVEVEGVFASS